MACQVKFTSVARKDVRSLPNAGVGKAIRKWIEDIAADPTARAEGDSFGRRVMDGIVMVGGHIYYCQVFYRHLAASESCEVVHVTARESRGLN